LQRGKTEDGELYIIRAMYNWIARHVHDKTTFFVVLSVAFLQLFLAVYGGLLAVPADSKRKWIHRLAFLVGGLMLFLLTFRAGLLTDAAQYNADQSISSLKTNVSEIGDNFTNYVALQGTKKPIRDSSKIDDATKKENLAEIDSHLNNIANRIYALLGPSSPSNNFQSKSNPLPTLAPTLQPSRVPLSQPTAIDQLNYRLDRMANCFQGLDSGTALKGQYYKPQFVFSGNRSAVVPNMISDIKGRDDGYSNCSDKSLREDAHTLFHMSPAEIAADDAKFKALEKQAKLPTLTEGLTPLQIWNLMFQAKYAGISHYFKQLQHPPAN
jgi:hypothetical protein